MNTKLPVVICLMGPTASGKTAIAEFLASQLLVDIISVDSALVYRGMNIGTAKPTPEELKLTPHRMIDIRDPGEPFSAGDFCCLAKQQINDIVSRQRIPLLVGGTMLYFNSLLYGSASLPPASEMVRNTIEREARERGWEHLHASLKAIDKAAFLRIHPNDKQRIQRALEVYRLTGQSISSFQHHQHVPLSARVINIILEPRDRFFLHQRIESRLMKMFDSGFIDEVRLLYERGDLHQNLPAIRAVGYRQVWAYLSGELEQSELFDRALYATRQLAKRQLTWLRRCPDAHRFYIEDENLPLRILRLIEGEISD